MKSIEILKHFSLANKGIFTFRELVDEFPGKSIYSHSKMLKLLVRDGLLVRLTRGIYYIVRTDETSGSCSPNWFELAKCLARGKDYYLGFRSALEFYGVPITRVPGHVIVTGRQVKPTKITIKEDEYRFVYRPPEHFFGFVSLPHYTGIQLVVSDLEKTIVDSSAKPGLCGGITVLAEAVYLTKDVLIWDKLFFYFSVYGDAGAKKRYLFLSDLLGLAWTDEHDRMLEEIGSGIHILDPGEANKGKRNSKFGLKVNVDTKLILHSIDKY